MARRIPPDKIKSWVSQHFDYKVRTGKNGDELLISNPFYHNDNKKYNISLSKATCHDWRSSAYDYSFIKFVSLYRKCSYKDALREVLGSSGSVSEYLRYSETSPAQKDKRTISVALPSGVSPLYPATDKQAKILKKWLGTRGYSEEDIEAADIHYLGMDVYWPYYEFGDLVYWQCRSKINKRFAFPPTDIKDADGNIIGVHDVSKSHFLYGFDSVKFASYVIITESIFDAHTLGEQALASGGAALSKKQIQKLGIIGPREGIILSPDNDVAGMQSVLQNHKMLASLSIPIFFSIPPKLKYIRDGKEEEAKDWNELAQYVTGFDAIRKLHDDNIVRATTSELMKLRLSLRKFLHV